MSRPLDAKKTAEGLQPHDGPGNQVAADCIAHGSRPRRHKEPRQARKQPMPGEVLREEVMFLIDDRSPEDIAAALGYASPGSIARAMHRLGDHELARPFDRAYGQQRRGVAA